MVNGGTYQDVPQLHFHLAGVNNGLRYTTPEHRSGPVLVETATLAAYAHPQPQRAVHVVVWPAERLVWADLAGPRGEEIGRELAPLAQQLVAQLQLGSGGFTLLASVPPGSLESAVCFHLVGGGRLT